MDWPLRPLPHTGLLRGGRQGPVAADVLAPPLHGVMEERVPAMVALVAGVGVGAACATPEHRGGVGSAAGRRGACEAVDAEEALGKEGLVLAGSGARGAV